MVAFASHGSRSPRVGRVRLGWLAPALLRPRVTELEVHDLVQTLLAQHRSLAVTDQEIRDAAGRQLGLGLGDEDLQRIRTELAEAGCTLAG